MCLSPPVSMSFLLYVCLSLCQGVSMAASLYATICVSVSVFFVTVILSYVSVVSVSKNGRLSFPFFLLFLSLLLFFLPSLPFCSRDLVLSLLVQLVQNSKLCTSGKTISLEDIDKISKDKLTDINRY